MEQHKFHRHYIELKKSNTKLYRLYDFIVMNIKTGESYLW